MKPECHLGLTRGQVLDLVGDRLGEFDKWMTGQTGGLCLGRQYNTTTLAWETACGGVSHGPVYYPEDVSRFLNGQPVVD
jgi:hypothetical protein